MKVGGRHSMASPEWFTPIPIVEDAWRVLGAIDVDPASCREAQPRVRAGVYYDQQQSGLIAPWPGRVFLNPPGGLVRAFWDRLMGEVAAGRTTAAIWIGYSLEQLQTLQGSEWDTPLAYPTCYPAKRIAFDVSDEERARLQAELDARMDAQGKSRREWSNSPTHANYITYVGYDVDRFAAIFSRWGEVVIPH